MNAAPKGPPVRVETSEPAWKYRSERSRQVEANITELLAGPGKSVSLSEEAYDQYSLLINKVCYWLAVSRKVRHLLVILKHMSDVSGVFCFLNIHCTHANNCRFYRDRH